MHEPTKWSGTAAAGRGASRPARRMLAGGLAALLAPLCCPGAGGVAEPAQAQPALEVVEPWSNVFGGREAVFHIRAQGPAAIAGRVGWRFAAGPATLARGERDVAVGVRVPAEVELRLQMPAVREGTVLRCTLTAILQERGSDRQLAGVERVIHAFPENPFAERATWLKSLDIRLFDPEERTRKVLESAGVPFTLLGNPDASNCARRT